MAYLEDKNLEFLQYCSTEDLQVLVDYLTKDKDGELRVSEELTSTEAYKKYYPHSLPMMWKQIAEELQHYGGNTFANGLRGTGVSYREILTDVAKKQKVNFNSNNSVEQIEQYILQSIMEKAIEEMSEEELKNFLTEMNAGKSIGTKQAMTAGALTVLRLGGFGTYKMAVIVANAVARSLLGRGLTFAGNATLTRTLGVALGPIGWIVTGLWTLLDIASPAYRVTIPCVIQVAYMRLKLQEEALKKNHFSERGDNAPKKESDSSFELKSFREANEKNIQYFFEEVQKLRNKNQLQDALMLLEQKESEFGFLPEFKLAKEQIIANIQRVKAKAFFDKIENLLDKFYKTYYKIEEINLNQVIKCLTTSELHIIEAIGENEITMNELSDKLGITMGTASVAVNKLTDKQFLERSRSDIDRRKVFVRLTSKGKVALNYHGDFHSNILEKITDDIPSKKLETFIEVFETIVQNLDKVKKDIQPESILNFEKDDLVQVSSIKGSVAIRKYLNEKGVMIKSLIKIINIDKYLITLLVDGDEKILNIEDAENIMVRKNAL